MLLQRFIYLIDVYAR